MAWRNLMKPNLKGKHMHLPPGINASSLLKPQNGRPFATGSLPTPVAPFSHNILDGAPEHVQKQWDHMSTPGRMQERTKYADTDGDGVPDPYDCEPFNSMRQHKKNRMFREQVEKKIDFAGLYNEKPKAMKAFQENEVQRLNEHVKKADQKEHPGKRTYPVARKGSYKHVGRQDIVNAVTSNPQIIPLLSEVHIDDLDPYNALIKGIGGRYHSENERSYYHPGNRIEMPMVTQRKADTGKILRHELAHHLQNTAGEFQPLSRASQIIKDQPYPTTHAQLPIEQDADRKLNTDPRLAKIKTEPAPGVLKTLFPAEQTIPDNNPMKDVDWSKPKRNEEYEKYAKNRPVEVDGTIANTTADYWDDQDARRDVKFVKRMSPTEFLERTTKLKIGTPEFHEEFDSYHDYEDGERHPNKKLQGHIDSKTTAVNIPFIKSDSDHEGRHRMASELERGTPLVPVETTAPASWTSKDVEDEWFKRQFGKRANDPDLRREWSRNFKTDFPTQGFDRKGVKNYRDILIEKGVYQESEYITDEEKERDRETTADYWDINKAKRNSQYVKWMKPLDYIKQAGLDPVNNPAHARQLNQYTDHEDRKLSPVSRLGERISDPDVPVTIPYLGNEELGTKADPYKNHEGRTRAWAAHLKGDKLVPVGVRPPASWTTDEVVDEYADKNDIGPGERYRDTLKHRFKQDNYQWNFTEEQSEMYQGILSRHNAEENKTAIPIKTAHNASDMTAAQRFGGANLQNLPKLGAGRDRNVYELPGQGYVVKIAKNPGGINQNDSEKDMNWMDQALVVEQGRDYVIQEKVDKPGKATRAMLKDYKGYSQRDFDLKTSEIQDTFEKHDQTDFMNYDLAFGDFQRKANWGTKNGEPVLLDGGTFNQGAIKHHTVSALREQAAKGDKWAETQLQEWEEVKAERKKYSQKGGEKPNKPHYPAAQVDMDKFFDDVITVTPKDQTVNMPIERAWDMRGRWAEPGDMTPKREPSTMEGISKSVDDGSVDPIEVDYDDYNKGVLTDGKHRLNVMRDKGMRQVPIVVKNVPEGVDVATQKKTFYHGTTSADVRGILNKGVRTSNDIEKTLPPFMKGHMAKSDKTNPDKTYYFEDVKDAETWAKVVASQHGGKPAIVKAQVNPNEMERDFGMKFGKSWSFKGSVPPEDVEEYDDTTADYVDESVKKRNKGRVHLDEYGKEDHASQLGLDGSRSVVHGTSMEKAQQIAHSGIIKDGTVVPPGRGGFEDASVWADNVYKDNGVVVVGEAQRDVTLPKNRWVTVGKRAEERKGIDATLPNIPLSKVKILKRSDVDPNELAEVEHDDGIYFPKGSNLTKEQMEDLDQNVRQTHDTEHLGKFDYVYRGRGQWKGQETDDYEFNVFPKGMRWEGKEKEISTPTTPLTPWNELKGKEGMVYRGMHEDEYNEAVKQGYFKSKGTHNIGQQEGDYTFGTKNIQQASSYADGFAPAVKKPQPGSTGVIVGFKNDGKWEEGSMENEKNKFIPKGEMATSQQIPVADVQEVYKFVPTKTKRGEYWAHKSFRDYTRSIDMNPNTKGGWKKEEEQTTADYIDPKFAKKVRMKREPAPYNPELVQNTIKTPGGQVTVLENSPYADGATSVTNLNVEEKQRQKGIATDLLEKVGRKYQDVSSQVSNVPSVKAHYNAGYRPKDNLTANKIEAVKAFQEAAQGPGSMNMRYVPPAQREEPVDDALQEQLTYEGEHFTVDSTGAMVPNLTPEDEVEVQYENAVLQVGEKPKRTYKKRTPKKEPESRLAVPYVITDKKTPQTPKEPLEPLEPGETRKKEKDDK